MQLVTQNHMNAIVRYISAVSAAFLCAGAMGQSLQDFYVETRLGYESLWKDSHHIADDTGFKGQWLNLRLDGTVTEGLTYSYRQRLNKPSSRTFFDATDWLHLDWKATRGLTLSAGKQVVAIGGYEYDRAPIDLYYCSEFWNNIPCYQLGVSATYDMTPSDALLFQVCNSPFREWIGNGSYAYNLCWYGSHGFWETIWSVNLMENGGSMMNYLALGNRFHFTDRIRLDVDVMNRAAGSYRPFSDWSVMSELSVAPSEAARVFVKFTHDSNRSGHANDRLVLDGTSISMASAGFEYMPAEAPDVKLFAAAFYGWGVNSNPAGTRTDRQLCCQLGLKWRLDILKSLK